jgi:hypothetical protein
MKTIENTEIISDEEYEKEVTEIKKEPKLIKGNCFDNLLENINKYSNRS